MKSSSQENTTSPNDSTNLADNWWARRLVGLVVSIPCIAVLIIAAWQVEVYPNRCMMVVRTGLPCPTCGMTRAFRDTVRGDLVSGFGHQPFGPILCSIVAILALAGFGQFITGKNILDRLCPYRSIGPMGLVNLRYWPLLLGASGTLAGWGLKIALHNIAGELPL